MEPTGGWNAVLLLVVKPEEAVQFYSLSCHSSVKTSPRSTLIGTLQVKPVLSSTLPYMCDSTATS